MGCSMARQQHKECSKSILKTSSFSLYVDVPDSGRIPEIAINKTKIHNGMVFQNKLLYPEIEQYFLGEKKHFITEQLINSQYLRSDDSSPKSSRSKISKFANHNQDDSPNNSQRNLKSPPPCISKSSNSFYSASSNSPSTKRVKFNLDGNQVFKVNANKKEKRKRQKITMDDLVKEFDD